MLEIAVRIGCVQHPSTQDLSAQWRYHKKALIGYIGQVIVILLAYSFKLILYFLIVCDESAVKDKNIPEKELHMISRVIV